MAEQLIDKDIIFNRAVELAHHSSWQSFSIMELATSLHCSLTDIKCYFRSKDDIAELFFDRADEAMLAITLMDHLLRHRAQNYDVTLTTKAYQLVEK